MELVLITLDLDKEIRVETNTLDFAMGEVLLMKCKNEKWRPLAYISKLLGIKVLRNNKWQIEDKLILKKKKVYVLKDESLRLEIQLYHNMLIVDHGRQ